MIDRNSPRRSSSSPTVHSFSALRMKHQLVVSWRIFAKEILPFLAGLLIVGCSLGRTQGWLAVT